MMPSFDFKTPHSVAEACRLLAQTGGRPIAGGTDVIPQMRAGRFRVDALIDLSRLEELSAIERIDGQIAVGALATYAALRDSPLLRAHAPLLAQVSGLIGGAQTQNRGTLGGNIANASPAGDTLPVLLALEATVDLVGVAGQRSLPLAGFLRGPGQTALARDEIIRRVRFAPLPDGARSLFLRLGNRRGMVISVAAAAFVLELDGDGRARQARLALGAVAPTAIRCPAAEAILLGRRPDAPLIEAAAAAAAAACRPIDDVRASAAYRRHIVGVLARRGLTRLARPEGVLS